MSSVGNEGVDSESEEMCPEYDFSGGVRGKHHQAYQEGHSVVVHRADKPSGLKVQEVESVVQRAESLGLRAPAGVCILPRRFFHAKDVSDLVYEPSSQEVKILLRQAGIPLGKIEPDGVCIPYQTEHDNTWVGPVIFFGVAFWSQNPNLVNVALSVISNYLTDWFKGRGGDARVKLGFVIETTDKKKTVRINYDGSPDGLSGIEKLIKDAMK
jgi:hypothetical protein